MLNIAWLRHLPAQSGMGGPTVPASNLPYCCQLGWAGQVCSKQGNLSYFGCFPGHEAMKQTAPAGIKQTHCVWCSKVMLSQQSVAGLGQSTLSPSGSMPSPQQDGTNMSTVQLATPRSPCGLHYVASPKRTHRADPKQHDMCVCRQIHSQNRTPVTRPHKKGSTNTNRDSTAANCAARPATSHHTRHQSQTYHRL